MTIDYSPNGGHSVWLSSEPCTFKTTEQGVLKPEENGDMLYFVPKDGKFFWLGGDTEINYSNTYNASIVGVFSQGPENAIFVDSASGCVSSISVTAKRVNPSDAVDTDGTNLNNISNEHVRALLEQMRGTNTQLSRGAYVLRVYNCRTNMPKLVEGGFTRLYHAGYGNEHPYLQAGDGYFAEYYVFLSSVNCSFELENPNVMSISLTFTIRSPVGGVNMGEDDEAEESE